VWINGVFILFLTKSLFLSYLWHWFLGHWLKILTAEAKADLLSVDGKNANVDR